MIGGHKAGTRNIGDQSVRAENGQNKDRDKEDAKLVKGPHKWWYMFRHNLVTRLKTGEKSRRPHRAP
eukprot:16343289-Heterocapsa_arctica.AAC.1